MPDHARYLACLVNVPCYHQNVAVIEAPADDPHDGASARRRLQRIEPRALHRPVKGEPAWHAIDVAGKARAGGTEQPDIVHMPGVLLEMIGDRADAATVRQIAHEVDLRGDHAVGARDQVVVELLVDEREQSGDEQREGGRDRQGPEKRVRADKLNMPHGHLAIHARAG
ncbi:MAG: hypothetical protein ACOY3N_15385 [Bradyrhizobium sp.]|uniref:hypothetical protein n=1 Tax=unclassified Bradyrhizobium TaxID=2631580 RepID=UPI001FCD0EC8|nr:hypothetical protein [Bradyrhizobium sp. Leaf396]